MRGTLTQELSLSIGMLLDDKPIVPRFRIVTGEGNFVLFAARQTRARDQRKSVRFIESFMLWSLARWFVFSEETLERDGAASFLVARDLRLAVRRRVRRSGTCGQVEWLEESAIPPEVMQLLPARSARMNQTQYRQLMLGLGRLSVEIAGPF